MVNPRRSVLMLEAWALKPVSDYQLLGENIIVLANKGRPTTRYHYADSEYWL